MDDAAIFLLAPQPFGMALAVVGDHGVGGLEDHSGGAVVLLQPDNPCLRIEPVEMEDVVNIGAAPAVDRLVVVADHGKIARLAGQQGHQLELDEVGILVFVDHQPLVAVAVSLQDLGVFLPKPHGKQQQVVKIQKIHLLEALLVALIAFGHLGGTGKIRMPDVIRPLRIGFGHRDAPAPQRRVVALPDLPQRIHYLHYQPLLVALGGNGEAAAVPQLLGMAPQHADAEGVEGADGHRIGRLRAKHPSDALAHLARGLVGEGDRHDGVRLDAMPHQVGNSLHNYRGLAGAGPRQQQQRPFQALHGLLLAVIHQRHNQISGNR